MILKDLFKGTLFYGVGEKNFIRIFFCFEGSSNFFKLVLCNKAMMIYRQRDRHKSMWDSKRLGLQLGTNLHLINTNLKNILVSFYDFPFLSNCG